MQSLALLKDSWRLLRSRKLFWVTLAINLVVVVLYGSIGFTPDGVSILYGLKHFDTDRFAIGTLLARELYLSLFSNIIVTLWLGWIAAALAVISTTSIFPDFLSEGAIDMVLAKPISRTRVFLVKYVGSLLFVFLQVATFCAGAFFCVGGRLGDWNWGLFIAIPLVVLFFSYLYCVNVLIGVVTRSTIAALIGTAIFWFVLWATSSAETLVRQIAYFQDEEAMRVEARRDRLAADFERLAAEGRTSEDNEFERVRGSLETARAEADAQRADAVSAFQWLNGIEWATAILPKHVETIALVDRCIGKDEQRLLADILIDDRERPNMSDERREARDIQRNTGRRMADAAKSESVWWIIGSSLGFELAVLAAGVTLFSRKDF